MSLFTILYAAICTCFFVFDGHLFFQSSPQKFCDMQRNDLNGTWVLSIRNGYKIDVVYDRQSKKLFGVGDLFSDFG